MTNKIRLYVVKLSCSHHFLFSLFSMLLSWLLIFINRASELPIKMLVPNPGQPVPMSTK